VSAHPITQVETIPHNDFWNENTCFFFFFFFTPAYRSDLHRFRLLLTCSARFSFANRF
jgi:hypothetical protein